LSLKGYLNYLKLIHIYLNKNLMFFNIEMEMISMRQRKKHLFLASLDNNDGNEQ